MPVPVPRMDEAATISVVIPAYCTEDRLGASRLQLTLAGFGRQSLPPEQYEVVIVDDGSDPPIRSLLSRWDVPCDVRVVGGEHAGIGAAYNLGVEAAQGEVLLFGLDDEVPGPSLLETHLAGHTGDRQVVVGCCRSLFHTVLFRDVIAGERLAGTDEMLPFNPQHAWLVGAARALDLADKPIQVADVVDHFDALLALSGQFSQFRDFEELMDNGCIHGLRAGWLAMRFGNHSISRETWRRVGRFDPALDQEGGWYQDLDLGIRLLASGARFRYEPRAQSLTVSHVQRTGADTEVAALAYLVTKYQTPDVALLPLYFARDMTIEAYSEALAEADRYWPARTARSRPEGGR